MTAEEAQPPGGRTEEASLSDILGILRRRYGTILVSTAVALALAVAYLLHTVPSYGAEARVLVEAPVTGSSALGNLANLPLPLSSFLGEAPQVAAEVEVLRSRPVLIPVTGTPDTANVVHAAPSLLSTRVDDLAVQSPWRRLLRKLGGEDEPRGGLAVEVTRWDFPDDFGIPLVVDVHGPDRVEIAIDRWFDRRPTSLAFQPGQPFEYEDATLVLQPDGDLTGRRFVITHRGPRFAVERFLEDLTISETDPGSNVLRISYEDVDAERAAETVNALVRSYLAHNRQRLFERSNRTVDHLQQELERVRGELDAAEHDLERFQGETGTKVLPETAVAVVEKLVEVDLERARTGLRAHGLRNLLDTARAGTLTPGDLAGIESLTAPAGASLVEPLAELLAKKRILEETYTDEWPPLVELNTRLEERMAAIVETLETQLWQDERLAADLQGIVDRFQSEMEGLPAVQLELARHSRRVRAFTEIYLFLLAQLEESQVARSGIVPNVEVIDWAAPPLKPSRPVLPLVLGLGLVLGFALGTCLAFLREAAAGVRLLHTIPRHRGARSRPLVVAGATRPRAAEAYRSLRGAFRHAVEGPRLVTVAVTSPRPREGRSLVALNLATALALAGERVLLVDGDLRAPTLHRWVGRPAAPGLAEVLAGEATAEDAIVSTEVPGLALLAAGTAKSHPGDLLSRPDVRALLASLAADHDRVILDTPAVLTSSEAVALGAAVDGILLVACARRTRTAHVVETAQRLRQAGGRLVGAILQRG